MLETIEAAYPVVSEPAFLTPEEAIDYSKAVNRGRHNNDFAECIGRRIEATDWRSDILKLHLDNGKSLCFQCVQNAVILTINDDMPNNISGGAQPNRVALLRLAGREIHWKRGELINALLGKVVIRTQASRTGFFLYVSDIGILALNVIVDCQSGHPLLFWELSD